MNSSDGHACWAPGVQEYKQSCCNQSCRWHQQPTCGRLMEAK